MAAKLSATEVRGKLFNVFGPVIDPEVYNHIVIIADRYYQTIQSEEWIVDRIINDGTLSKDRYRKEIFDCDDYVTYLKTQISLLYANNSDYDYAAAIGYILTSLHAFNIMINDDKDICIVDTDSDDVYTLNASLSSTTKLRNFLDLGTGNKILHLYI